MIMAVLALLAISAQTQQSQSGHIHIVRKRAPSAHRGSPVQKGAATQPGPSGAQLLYYGGPVVSNVKVVVVFWGPSVNATVTSGIVAFFGVVTNSVYYDVVSEYSTNGVTPTGGAPSTNQTLGRGTVDTSYTITPSVCNTTPCTVYDDQIQTELNSQIQAGHLPEITTDSQGIPDTMYMIYFPKGVSINDGTASSPDPTGNSCVDFCGYHGTGTRNAKELLYGVMPDFSPGSGCDLGCGNSSMFNDVTMVSSHELLEVATDPGVGLAPLNAPPLAWYDQTNGEVGDICSQDQDQVNSSNASGYSIQLVWSNVQNACVDGPPQYLVSAPSMVQIGTPFNVAVFPRDNVGTFLATYKGAVNFSSSDPAALLPADGGSSSIFHVTLNTLGSQTLTVRDNHTLAMVGVASVKVVSTPVPQKRRGQVVSQFRP